MTTPTIMLIQTFYYKKSFSFYTKMALTLTCIGVIITTATDVHFNWLGTFYATLGVIITSLYQIWVQTGQEELKVNSMQLLYYQAPISALILLFTVPVLDDLSELADFVWTWSSFSAVLLSAILAFFVNLSTFLIIGKTSPMQVTFFY